jgi:hypothetical protein
MINDAGKHEVKVAAAAVTLSACEDAVLATVSPFSPLPLGERAGVRGLNPLDRPVPLTRLASLADLSPQGRGEDRVRGSLDYSLLPT